MLRNQLVLVGGFRSLLVGRDKMLHRSRPQGRKTLLTPP